MRTKTQHRHADHRRSLRFALRGKNASPSDAGSSRARPKSGASLRNGQLPADLADRRRIQFMLRGLNARMKAFSSVVR